MTYSQEKVETSAATAISGSRVAGRAASGSLLVPLAPLATGSSIVLDIYHRVRIRTGLLMYFVSERGRAMSPIQILSGQR